MDLGVGPAAVRVRPGLSLPGSFGVLMPATPLDCQLGLSSADAMRAANKRVDVCRDKVEELKTLVERHHENGEGNLVNDRGWSREQRCAPSHSEGPLEVRPVLVRGAAKPP